MPLLAEELLHRLQASPPHTTWKVDCSFVEIYNEQAYDLLEPDAKQGAVSLATATIIHLAQDGGRRPPRGRGCRLGRWAAPMLPGACLSRAPWRRKCTALGTHCMCWLPDMPGAASQPLS